jgi:hypothetical protein
MGSGRQRYVQALNRAIGGSIYRAENFLGASRIPIASRVGVHPEGVPTVGHPIAVRRPRAVVALPAPSLSRGRGLCQATARAHSHQRATRHQPRGQQLDRRRQAAASGLPPRRQSRRWSGTANRHVAHTRNVDTRSGGTASRRDNTGPRNGPRTQKARRVGGGFNRNCLVLMVPRPRFERGTFRLGGGRSIP